MGHNFSMIGFIISTIVILLKQNHLPSHIGISLSFRWLPLSVCLSHLRNRNRKQKKYHQLQSIVKLSQSGHSNVLSAEILPSQLPFLQMKQERRETTAMNSQTISTIFSANSHISHPLSRWRDSAVSEKLSVKSPNHTETFPYFVPVAHLPKLFQRNSLS